MKKFALILAVLLLACCLMVTLVACGENGQDGKDGANGRNGKDGLTPYIGTNGNWFIGDTDTGVLAQGADGENGKDGTVGKSAFELYKDSHPEFEGTEEDWLNGLIGNGRAPETGEFAYAKNADGVSYTLVSYTGADFGVDIPVSYAGFPVTAIGGNAFKDNKSINSITIHNKITSIGASAFYGCSGLTNITIPDSVKSIGSYAFYECRKLTSIIIPDSVTSIGASAFYECWGLTSVTIGNSVTSIGNRVFYNCIGLTNVTIPNSVTSIGNYAFSGCSKLTSITFADTTTWYYTDNATNWQNKTGGYEIDVTNASTNVTYFKSTYYYDYYWYKL